jgi:hypothetical protein
MFVRPVRAFTTFYKMSNEQKNQKAKKEYTDREKIEIFDLEDLFQELFDFNGEEKPVLLYHIRCAFSAYAKESPNATQDAFATYGKLVELINAISSSRDPIYKQLTEFQKKASKIN